MISIPGNVALKSLQIILYYNEILRCKYTYLAITESLFLATLRQHLETQNIIKCNYICETIFKLLS